jgi:hypothetical protein
MGGRPDGAGVAAWIDSGPRSMSRLFVIPRLLLMQQSRVDGGSS